MLLRPLDTIGNIRNFLAISELEKGYFDAPITFIGFPTSQGNGSSICPDIELSITSKAKNPDGAWEFIKYYIGDEYQNQIASSSLPIKISAYDIIKENVKNKPVDSFGEYDNLVWLGNDIIDVGVNTDKDNEKMMKFIESVTTTSRYDENLYQIVIEEVESYFSGQKNVDEVTEIIQNRANIYIKENK